MSGFRLALINPNTERRHTAAMAEAIAAVLPEGAEVRALQPGRGPRSIESSVDGTIAAAEVVALVAGAPAHDAYLIGCFGDPGLHAVRELVDAPVVGIGEAALHAASMLAPRFAVITTLARGVPAIEDAVDAAGLARRCVGVLTLEIPVAAQGGEFPETTGRIIALGREAVAERSAGALVLACGGMSDVTLTVSDAVGVPATNGVAIGALIAHALWRAGLRTSAAGPYAPPEQIPYDGMAAPRPFPAPAAGASG